MVERERFTRDVEWPGEADDGGEEPVDRHQGPLDDPDDIRWLERDDPRRLLFEESEGD
jgi:hypothetical protein